MNLPWAILGILQDGRLAPGAREALAALGGIFLGAGIALLLARREAQSAERLAAQPEVLRQHEAVRQEVRSELSLIEGDLKQDPAARAKDASDPLPIIERKRTFLRIDPIRMEEKGREQGQQQDDNKRRAA